MHHDRNHGTWSELKAKRHDKFDNPKFDDEPLDSLSVMHSNLDGESDDIQKVKRDRAVKQLNRVQNMFKDMTDYAENNSENNSIGHD